MSLYPDTQNNYPKPGGNVANWSLYKAIAPVDINGKNILGAVDVQADRVITSQIDSQLGATEITVGNNLNCQTYNVSAGSINSTGDIQIYKTSPPTFRQVHSATGDGFEIVTNVETAMGASGALVMKGSNNLPYEARLELANETATIKSANVPTLTLNTSAVELPGGDITYDTSQRLKLSATDKLPTTLVGAELTADGAHGKMYLDTYKDDGSAVRHLSLSVDATDKIASLGGNGGAGYTALDVDTGNGNINMTVPNSIVMTAGSMDANIVLRNIDGGDALISKRSVAGGDNLVMTNNNSSVDLADATLSITNYSGDVHSLASNGDVTTNLNLNSTSSAISVLKTYQASNFNESSVSMDVSEPNIVLKSTGNSNAYGTELSLNASTPSIVMTAQNFGSPSFFTSLRLDAPTKSASILANDKTVTLDGVSGQLKVDNAGLVMKSIGYTASNASPSLSLYGITYNGSNLTVSLPFVVDINNMGTQFLITNVNSTNLIVQSQGGQLIWSKVSPASATSRTLAQGASCIFTAIRTGASTYGWSMI